jgi:hypothetical protein
MFFDWLRHYLHGILGTFMGIDGGLLIIALIYPHHKAKDHQGLIDVFLQVRWMVLGFLILLGADNYKLYVENENRKLNLIAATADIKMLQKDSLELTCRVDSTTKTCWNLVGQLQNVEVISQDIQLNLKKGIGNINKTIARIEKDTSTIEDIRSKVQDLDELSFEEKDFLFGSINSIESNRILTLQSLRACRNCLYLALKKANDLNVIGASELLAQFQAEGDGYMSNASLDYQ